LGLAAAQVVNANLTLTLGSATTFENIVGGAQGDTLIGNAIVNALIGGPGNDWLEGSLGSDIYLFDADTQLGSDTLVESASGGTDLFDFSATSTQVIVVDLLSTAGQVVNSNLTLTLSSGSTFENLTGGTLGDTLSGNSLVNVLTGGAGNDTLTGGDGNDTLVGGAGNDSLTGGNGNDLYSFTANSALGSDTVIETAGGGTDLLDFSSTTTLAVVADLGNTAPQVVNGNLTLTLSASDAFENVTGGSLNDVLTGNTQFNVLTGNAGSDTLTGGDGNDTLVGGAGNDTLTGGNGNDLYSFTANSALGSDTVTEAAGGGTDLLDFSSTTTLAVVADLGNTAPQAVNGNLTLTLSASDAFENVTGGSLNDVLTGNTQSNVLTGGAGNDSLKGLGGRDLLSGGSGVDNLLGGDEDDLLISGTLTYFNESTKLLDRQAIDAIMAEWTRSDADYLARITNLRNGGGLNGVVKLNSTTIFADGTTDMLSGGNGVDWFWSFGNDQIDDLGTGGAESVN
jgi:serralysin